MSLLVSIFQPATQIQEMTLTFMLRIVAVIPALTLFLPRITNRLVTFTAELFNSIPMLTS